MNANSLLDMIGGQLQGGTIDDISSQLGTDANTTSNAISMALPILLGGLASNAAQPAGAQALDQALGEDHDGALLDNVSSLFGMGGAGSGAGGAGAKILGHILGGRQAPIEQGVGRATGMSTQQVSQLLMMLAPLVMAGLGRMKRQQGMGAQQLPGVLQNERAEIERRAPEAAGLGGLFDMNKDGQIMDDIARIGTGVLGGILGGGGRRA
ncbi:MAG TPA: DUF937 domain-containing protein [Thermoanaerobaculia bacterium]|nr:DUF937 domain-containing protein [Thermoanaerobaculia bacterium]